MQGKIVKTNRLPIAIKVCNLEDSVDASFACPICEQEIQPRGPVDDGDGFGVLVLVCEEHGAFLPKARTIQSMVGHLNELARHLIEKYGLPEEEKCWTKIAEPPGDPWMEELK